MNQDGGLSYFDLNAGNTTEILDNTTFVSIQGQKGRQDAILDQDSLIIVTIEKKIYNNDSNNG